MTEQYQNRLKELATTLVTPQRYGGLALTLALLPGEGLQADELAEVIQLPTLDSFDPDQLELFSGQHQRLVTDLAAYRDQRRAAELKPPA